ncbi:MAG: hypothetical protein J2P17_35035 [Mycobacterium sp.]|nr:hypothetical protein [Mycobacterium sp.]
MSVATPGDVVARWPSGYPPPDTEAVQVFLDDVHAIVSLRYGACISDLTPDQEAIVRMVEARMVVRALTNPRGVTREQVGDTSVFYADVHADVGLSPDDMALLDALCGIARGLASVPLEREDREAMVWMEGEDLPEWWEVTR